MKRSEINEPANAARRCRQAHDDVYADPAVKRAKAIDEHEPAAVRLIWERPSH